MFIFGYLIILVISIVYFNAYNLSFWVIPVTLVPYSLVFSLLRHYLTYPSVSQKRNIEKLYQEPCIHGVLGGKTFPHLCSQCRKTILDVMDAEKVRKETKYKEIRQKEYDIWKAKARMPEYLKSMDPREFEILVCHLYEIQGYAVELTSYGGDGGIDAYLRLDSHLTLLQCKRYKGSVGEPAIRDLYGTITHEEADSGLIVTTGKVSKQAKAWIRDKPINIVELEELTEMIRRHLNDESIIPADFSINETIKVNPNTCPDCGNELRKVKGKYGVFIGCSGYPNCRYTRKTKYKKHMH
jgi:Restriction endonuclease/Topoisomerase DNA binding C4 zinc finger